jgi:hypothetical protein
MFNCHCRDCQRYSGSAYFAVLGVPRSALKVTGEVKFHETKGDSGNILARGFCPNCGSWVCARSSAGSDVVVLIAASLDDPSIFKPAMDIFTSSAQPWDHMNPALPKFPQMPPRQ